MKTAERLLALGLAAILAIVSSVAAQERPGLVEGRVVDLAGEPVAGVWLSAGPNLGSTVTDSLGLFVLTDLPPGTYTLAVSHPDYRLADGTEAVTVSVFAGRTSKIRIEVQLLGRSERRQQTALDSNYQGVTDGPQSSVDKTRVEKEAPSVTGDQSVYLSPVNPGASPKVAPDALVQIYRRPTCPPDNGVEYDKIIISPDAMYFRDYGTNGFVETRRDRLSTFALDVDDASFNLARRYLEIGQLPPTDAIRVEDFVNHFDYGYNPPQDRKFRIFAEVTDSPFENGRAFLKIGIKGREVSEARRKPLNLTLVIDVSGSMARDNRIGLIKQSLDALLSRLDGGDRVGIVAYGSEAWAVLEPVSSNRRDLVMQAVNSLRPGGRTYAEAGLKLGYRMAAQQSVNGHSNLIVLCSDGVANVGRTGPEEIMREVSRFVREGIVLNTYGFGMGNFNDVLLEQLAQKGNGRYAYIDTHEDIDRAFVSGFIGNTEILARDVKVQVEFNPKSVTAYRLLGYENRSLPDQAFRDNRCDGGEVGAGHEITAIYEIEGPWHKIKGALATISVRYKDADGVEVTEVAIDATIRDHYRKLASSRPELRLALAASRFAEMLKQTPYSAETSFAELMRLVDPLRHELGGRQVEELADLIERASRLSGFERDDFEDEDYFSSDYRR